MRSYIVIILLVLSSVSMYSQQILVIGSGEAWSDPEHKEIMRYFGTDKRIFSWINGDETNWKKTDLSTYDIIWLHRTDSMKCGKYEDDNSFHQALLSYADEGGKILLTQHALDFVNKSGLEPQAVEHRSKESEDNGYGRMLGFHAFRSHPLFDSLNGGSYVWKPPHDTTVTQCGFFGDALPKNGKVVAVDWDYIFVRESSKLIVEYEHGKGKILGIGAYFNLYEPNLNRQHFNVFYENVFSYLMGENQASAGHYWLYGDYNIEPIQFVLERQLIPPPAREWQIQDNWMALGRDKAQKEYCEVAGKRMLVAAFEQGGIFEVWAHPFMALRDYKVKLIIDNEEILPGEILPSIEITPESVIRTYMFDNGAILKEVMVVSPDQPGGVIHYEYEGPEANLCIQYKSNMRLMWPYSGKVLKTLKYGYQPGLNAIEFFAPEADLLTLLGSNKIPLEHYIKPTNDTLFELMAELQFALTEMDQIDIIFAAGSEGRDNVIEAYMMAMQDPESIYKASVKHYKYLQDSMLSITSPDDNFNKGFAWALAATDRFFVTTPGLGTSIVAGYNGTDRGWDGGHAVNGRPGYAWYFGRDAVWSAFAILDYGDFKGVRDILDMFVKYQDLNGKIYHELSTSGFVHYDASDATPLFIILAGRYLSYSGDKEYIESIWPAIEKAYQYCLSTDTDGDGLIENTNVGHGWVEGGHLFGSHTSLYLASCWVEACRQISSISKSTGHESEGFESYKRFLTAKSKILEFENTETGFYNQGIFRNGDFHTEQSILPSIPLYFDQLPLDSANHMLRSFASHEYSSDWGIRMASVYNKHYHPRGYHSGAVWPLYTGWVALAEYKNDRHLQGFSHIMSNLNIYHDFALGYTEEVLNGEKYLPSGVCPHQCWSETMVLLPIIYGILGYESHSNEITLSPSIPCNWNSFRARNIKSGKSCFTFEMKREKDKTIFRFSEMTDTVGITFDPFFLPGTQINRITIGGREISNNGLGNGMQAYYSFSADEEIIVYHSGGISLIPPIEKAAPEVESREIRIVDAKWGNNTYTIVVEGAPAQSYELELINNFGSPSSVEGVENYREEGKRLFLQLDFPALNRRYTPRTVEIRF